MLTPHNRQRRILIVDDEPTLVFFLKQGLQESEHCYFVEGAASGEEALTKLTYNRYDLLITDLKMPGISGFTLVEIARSLHPHINVILITAFGSLEVKDEAQHLQVDGYLTKPFPMSQLQGIVHQILENTHTSPKIMTAEPNNKETKQVY
jgi:YesN/AraC family two-component response regulator